MSFAVPFALPVTHTDGRQIRVEGVVKPDAKRVTFALAKGTNLDNDVPYVLEYRFPDKVVVQNHNAGSHWGPEDRSGRFVLEKGVPFEFVIEFRSGDYQVHFNKAHYFDFKHRMSKDIVKNFLITGDVVINRVDTPGAPGYGAPAYGASHGGQGGHDHHNPPIPFTAPVDFHSAKKVIIRGTALGTNRFSVYLLSGGPHYDPHDVAVVIDVRFNFGSSHNVVVLNHKHGGHWGSEDRNHGFPFAANTEYEIVIKIKEGSYKIFVNEEKFAKFPGHIKPESVTHLRIDGDTRLSYVKA